MRQNPCFKVALVLFLLSSASWAAQPAPSNDPLWRALMLAPQSTADLGKEPSPGIAALFLATKSQCTASATCGGSAPVSCNGTTTCTAVDQSCPGERGYVRCDSAVTFCAPCDPEPPNCSEFDHGSCTYSWDAESNCCVAPPPDPETVCPYACF